MRKIYLCFISILAIPIFSLFFGMKVFAYDGLSKFQEDCHNVGINPSDSWLESLDNIWSQNPDYKGAFFISTQSINGAISNTITPYDNNRSFDYGSGYFAYWASWTNGVDSVGAGSYGPVNGVTLFQYSNYSEASPASFELSNMKNDFNVSAPSLVIDNVLVGGTNPYKVPYKITLYDHAWNEDVEEPTPLYLYMTVRYWTPKSVNGSTKNGFQYWNVNKYKASSGYVLNTYNTGDVLPSSGSSTFNMNDVDVFLQGWEDFRSGVTTEFTGEFASETQQSSWNDYAKNAGIYGNRVEIYCCYFYELNGEFYSGLWTHWISDQPQEISIQQIGDVNQNSGKEANGTSSVVMPNDAKAEVETEVPNMPVNIPNNATNVNVTINNPSVPNNQNYPTVVSYNHDNIFTQFVGTYNNASQYLGGFAGFCQGVLAWIPYEIWSIIGTGFAMAIVIMVVKIL